MADPSNKWAVLIGVNHYSDEEPGMNLNGCCNDVMVIYSFLRNNLHVPDGNIKVLLAFGSASSTFTDEFPTQNATKDNVLTAIYGVEAQARKGDYVHIHFSGHGDRQETNHPDKKPLNAKDEVLCLPDGDITDVEFGEILDRMATNFVVLATLDCCFSGGATRHKHPNVRCRSNYKSLVNEYHHRESAVSESRTARGSRTAIPTQSWLYRNREYNAITACHPFEEAHENCPESGKWHGALTRTLMDCLGYLGPVIVSTTYAQLHGFLAALMRDQLESLQQQPMLLGERNRLLFKHDIVLETEAPAYVIKISGENVVINRGESSGSVLGDIYSLRSPGTSNTLVLAQAGAEAPAEPAIQIEITSLDTFSSHAKIVETPNTNRPTSSQNIKVGWLATHIERPTVSYARILDDSSDSSKRLLSDIEINWKSFVDPIVKIGIIFPGHTNELPFSEDIKFYINLQGSTCTILNAEKQPFENFPTLTEQTPEFTKRLMYLLGHLQTYLLVNELKTTNSKASMFELSIEEIEGGQNDLNHTSTWDICFRNLSSEVLFVTIFNLSPLYGIQKIVPCQAPLAQAVESHRRFSQIVDIEIPNVLEPRSRDPSFQMTDVIKTFVTVQPIDLRHLELSDLEDTTPRQLRHVRAREAKRSSWWVEEKKIITGPIRPQVS